MTKNPENQAEDADFLDVEDFDDGLDETSNIDDDEWDEFDESLSGSNSSSSSELADKARAFVKKHFNTIVISAAVIGGLFIISAQLGKTPTQPTPPTTEVTQSTALETQEPQPSPGEIDLPVTQEPSIAAQETALPAADFTTPPAAPALIDEPTVPAEQTSDLLTPMPIFSDDPQQADVISDMAPLDLPEMLPEPQGEPQAEQTQQEPVFVETQAIVPAPATENIPAIAQADLNAIQDRIENINTQLLSRIDETDRKLSALADTLKALDARLSDFSKMPTPIDTTPKVVDSVKAVPVKKTEAPKAPTVKKVAKKVTKPKVKAPVWQLRSAQPGKAVLAAKGTSDIITIEEGMRVDGLGTILSITFDQGQWVVKGTTGQVKQ